MIDMLAQKVGDAQTKKPWAFITVFLVVIALVIPGIFLLVGNVEASLENVLPSTISEISAMNHARTHYQADMIHLLIEIEPPLTNVYDAQDYLEGLAQRLITIPNVKQVQYYLTEKNVNFDQTRAVLDLQTDTGTSSARITTTIAEIEEAILAEKDNNPGIIVTPTGFAAIDRATFSTIMSDFLVITGVAMFFIFAIVFSMFRKLRDTLIPMAAVMTALLITMGVTGYMGTTITVVTMVAAAMILGLGIDFGIHIIHSFNEYKKTRTTKAAIKRTVNELFRAQLGASMTTSAGFLALTLGVLPAMADLGIVLAIGIVSTFLASTLLLPPLLLITEQKNTRGIKK